VRLVKAIMDCAEPTTVTEMRRFLGMLIQVYKRAPRYSEKLKALSATVSNAQGKRFEMTPEAREAMEYYKAAVARMTLLTTINPKSKDVIITTSDASKTHIGGSIRQGGSYGGYYSRALTATVQSWAPIDREYLAMVEVIMHFEPMFGGARVVHQTDQEPLVHWQKLETEILGPKGQRRAPARLEWSLEMSKRPNVRVEWIPGAQNVVSDAMTRKPFAVDAKAEFVAANVAVTQVSGWTDNDWSREQALISRREMRIWPSGLDI
jgi:hypothetical protein